MKAIGISLLLVLFSGESIASEKAQHVQAAYKKRLQKDVRA